MANIYVRSSDGNNADNGSTWALAKATLAGAASIDAAGDDIFISSAHSESTASTVTIGLAGTYASPVTVRSVDDTGNPEPPTATSPGALVATTSTNPIAITGVAYISGVDFNCGSGATGATMTIASNDGNRIVARNCNFRLVGTGTAVRVTLGSTSAGVESNVDWASCNVRFANASQSVSVAHCSFSWEGGGIESGGTAPTQLIRASADQFFCELSGLDLSQGDAAMNIFSTATTLGAGKGIIRNCKLPASWSGVLAEPSTFNVRYEMWNCDSGDTNYRMEIVDYVGNIKSETTIVRSGGASDGDTPISWKITSLADADYPTMVLRSPETVIRNTTTGSSITATIEIVHDSTTALKDDEIWIECMYLGTAGYPLGTWVSDAKATTLTTAANQTSSSVTWTTTGITNVNKQKLSVSFTPQEKGYIHARVCLAKASYTVYACPKIDIT